MSEFLNCGLLYVVVANLVGNSAIVLLPQGEKNSSKMNTRRCPKLFCLLFGLLHFAIFLALFLQQTQLTKWTTWNLINISEILLGEHLPAVPKYHNSFCRLICIL